MFTKQIEIIDAENYREVIRLLQTGDFYQAEALVFKQAKAAGASVLETAMAEVTESQEGQALVTALQTTYHYRSYRPKSVQVVVAGGQRITVPSYYALAPAKKMGRPKKGPNGSGTHVLLAYWGFTRKRSPGSIAEITRCGAASASYELAHEQLKSQGIAISDMGIGQLVNHVGTIAIAHRPSNSLELSAGETLAGKRIAIGLDGGRIRSRQTKTGRPKTGQKGQRYDTDWKEPKLLVISELDENGNQKKGTKPLYEATMNGKEEFGQLLVSLSQQLHLAEAKEIVALGDGAPGLWDVFKKLQQELRIKGKVTEVVDFFHACEHITELTEAHTLKSVQQQQEWYAELKDLLHSGKFQAFKSSVEHEAAVHNLPKLLERFKYFQRHKDRMHYDRYEKAKLPIGSGLVESAIRRVINGRLKAPGTFWKLENAENLLTLRCALMAGRWDTFMGNFRQAVSIQPNG